MRSFFAVALLALPAFSQPASDDAFLNALFAVRSFHQVAISPDGKRVGWSEKDHGIWIADADGQHLRQLTKGDDEGLAWSPDSRSLAYLMEKDGQKQLYVGEERLTN